MKMKTGISIALIIGLCLVCVAAAYVFESRSIVTFSGTVRSADIVVSDPLNLDIGDLGPGEEFVIIEPGSIDLYTNINGLCVRVYAENYNYEVLQSLQISAEVLNLDDGLIIATFNDKDVSSLYYELNLKNLPNNVCFHFTRIEGQAAYSKGDKTLGNLQIKLYPYPNEWDTSEGKGMGLTTSNETTSDGAKG